MGQVAVGAATRRNGKLGATFKKLLGAYLMGTALFVAVWFIINPFFDASGVWDVANYLMAAALVGALLFNARRKLRSNSDEEGDRLRPWEINLCLYLTIGVAVLFLRNWSLEMAGAGGDDSMTGLVWITVNVLFPLTAGTAGVALWRDSAQPWGRWRRSLAPPTDSRSCVLPGRVTLSDTPVPACAVPSAGTCLQCLVA